MKKILVTKQEVIVFGKNIVTVINLIAMSSPLYNLARLSRSIVYGIMIFVKSYNAVGIYSKVNVREQIAIGYPAFVKIVVNVGGIFNHTVNKERIAS
jgi:hypothetical protein